MDAQAKQQVAERIKQATNILVTVSTDPSVDQLAACIGLTLLLNKLNKHATAVFSGKVPSTIEFLQPEKTIETNTDSLRDFIISLDKAKADKLRYKVEDQFVRIFITPYKTSLSEKDLVFSQGDYNVEVVLALGVKDQKQLDAAITAHGRILHDATVVSINAGPGKAPNLGQINWQDPSASSLSEMLAAMSETFGSNLIDGQIATAFLTGIVAETVRFSNNRTSSKVMTMSAQLMAAGANQQLIASKLEPPEPPPTAVTLPWSPDNQPPKSPKPAAPPGELKSSDGSLEVSHDIASPTNSAEVNVSSNEIMIDPEGNLKRLAEIAAQKAIEAETAKKQAEEARNAASLPQIRPDTTPLPAPGALYTPAKEPVRQSSMPGSHTLLSPLNGSPLMETAFTANTQPEWRADSAGEGIDNMAQGERGGMIGHAPDVTPPSHELPNLSIPPPTASPVVDDARSAVDSALLAAPFDPASSPVQSLNASPLADNLHPTPPNDQTAPAAPPPLPPPLMPAQGVIIPPPFKPAANNVVSNNNS